MPDAAFIKGTDVHRSRSADPWRTPQTRHRWGSNLGLAGHCCRAILLRHQDSVQQRSGDRCGAELGRPNARSQVRLLWLSCPMRLRCGKAQVDAKRTFWPAEQVPASAATCLSDCEPALASNGSRLQDGDAPWDVAHSWRPVACGRRGLLKS